MYGGDYHAGNERDAKYTGLFRHSYKTKTHLLESRLKWRNSLDKGVIVSFERIRQADTVKYYSVVGDVVHRNSIPQLTLRRLMSYIYIWSTHS